jgi:hypothetical protein
MNISCIEHSSRQSLVLIREDYVQLAERLGSPDHACTAAILNVFEHWTNVKIGASQQGEIENRIAEKEGLPSKGYDLWIYKSQPDLQAELMGIWGVNKVGVCLNWLVEQTLLLSRSNPLYKWDRTKQYLLNVDKINELLQQVSFNPSPFNSPNHDNQALKLKDESHKNKAAIPEITTEITPEIKSHSPIGAEASSNPEPDLIPPKAVRPPEADNPDTLSADDFTSYREHIRQIFRVTEGRDLGILHQLRGTAKKGAYKTHKLTPPVTLDELKRFGEWMRVSYPAIYISSPEKIRDYIQRFRQAYPVNAEPEEYGGIDLSTPEAQEALNMLTNHWKRW